VGVLPAFRSLVCGSLLVFAAPGLARVVPIKEDPNARTTAFRRVPPDVARGLSGQRLRDKVLRYALEYAPDNDLDIRYNWYVYPECDGRLILEHQVLTPSMQRLQISCGR
jgi:hypothetical protein